VTRPIQVETTCATTVRVHRSKTPATILTLGLFALTLTSMTVTAEEAWTHAEPELMVDDIRVPVDIAFGGDGYVYIALLTPLEVWRADAATGELDEDFRVEFPGAYWQIGTETGLFSIALHPDFAQNGVFFASYSRNESWNWYNVLSRITLVDASGGMEEEVLLTRPGGHWHNGGRVMVAGDHLWWTTGDTIAYYDPQEYAEIAQDDGNLVGKVLRLTMDGAPAPGNPWNDHAYTKGHRNVFGIAWDPEHERVLVTENGHLKTDYLYVLEAGANYGWPDCEGACEEPHPDYTDPIWQADHTIGPTGAIWYRGAFWWTTFHADAIYRTHDRDGAWETERVLGYGGEGRGEMLAITVHPDGTSLWYTTYDQLWRLPFTEHDDWPAAPELAEGPYWWELVPDDSEDTPGAALAPATPLALVLLLVTHMVARRRARPHMDDAAQHG
jgi:glucose/arabinose dehydrogenase